MTPMKRRTFLQTLAATAYVLPSFGQSKRLPIGFSTLGCPKWEWEKILAVAAEHGYAALELRGLMGQMDLTKRPEFAPDRIEQTKKDVASRNLKISCLGASSHMHETDPARRAAQMDEGRRFIDLASQLGVPYVRVFGDKLIPNASREESVRQVAAGLRELGEYAAPKNVTVILESHGDYTDSPTLAAILQQAGGKGVAFLWDAHHTFAASGEPPDVTVKQLGRFIRHTHLKDSKKTGSSDPAKAREYVLTGDGDVPVRDQVRQLVKMGYRGYYSFEWEKMWHPEIPDPEIAIPHFAKVIREYLTT
jgi:sugar phosphate isomerase/epimerase